MATEITLTTCPDQGTADTLAKMLVEQRLAACVNQIGGIRSTYAWQGEIHHDEEVLMIIKSTTERYAELEAAIHAHHPYELPEIITLKVTNGLAGYLAWVAQQTDNTQ